MVNTWALCHPVSKEKKGGELGMVICIYSNSSTQEGEGDFQHSRPCTEREASEARSSQEM